MNAETLIRVVAPRFVAGFVLRGGRCVKSAPVLRRHLAGRSEGECRAVVRAKGWKAGVVLAPGVTPWTR